MGSSDGYYHGNHPWGRADAHHARMEEAAMKILPWATLATLAVTVGAARADISLQWRRVTADSGTFESQHEAEVPVGFKSWQLLVTTDTKWIGSEMDLLLDEGMIYYNDLGDDNNPTPPDTALFGQLPSTRFGSHFSGTRLDAASGQRQTTSFAPDPVRRNKNKTYTDREITTTWFTAAPDDEVAGTFVIMMLTLSDNARGSVRAATSDPESGHCFDCPPPIPPFILEYPIVDGEIIVPEPSTALLAILGLVGLIGSRIGRKTRLPG